MSNIIKNCCDYITKDIKNKPCKIKPSYIFEFWISAIEIKKGHFIFTEKLFSCNKHFEAIQYFRKIHSVYKLTKEQKIKLINEKNYWKYLKEIINTCTFECHCYNERGKCEFPNYCCKNKNCPRKDENEKEIIQ